MSELSPFQEKCSDELKKALQVIGCKVRSWEIVTGRRETYIKADLGAVRLWIYKDGADWEGRDRDRGYESPDYDSLDDLQAAFIRDVRSFLDQDAT